MWVTWRGLNRRPSVAFVMAGQSCASPVIRSRFLHKKMSSPGHHVFCWRRGVPQQPKTLVLLLLSLLLSMLCVHRRCSSELSYSCSYCLSSHSDKVWLWCAWLGQQSTQRPPSVAVSIRLYQMLHSLCLLSLVWDKLISSSTWCTEGWSWHPWGPSSHTFMWTLSLGCSPGEL